MSSPPQPPPNTTAPPPEPPPNTTAPPPPTTTTDYFKSSAARQKPKNQQQQQQQNPSSSIYQTLYNNKNNPQQQQPFPPPTSSQKQQQHRPLYPNSRTTHQQTPAAAGVSYPVASSGRGFLPKQSDDAYRPVSGYWPYGYSSSEHLQQTLLSGGASSAVGMITGGSGSESHKVVGQSSAAADDNSLKHIRDKNGDDNFVIIRDRKVPVSEGTSLYAQCRSWLKNGFTMENQPQYVDHVKSLPKPLPASVIEASKEDDTEMEENTEDVGNLSAKELLQQHVKHAKKVRARLRNQRLQRIERYKDRLALLLPPVGDQQPKSDPVS